MNSETFKLTREQKIALHFVAGPCLTCPRVRDPIEHLEQLLEHEPSVIINRDEKSATFQCARCLTKFDMKLWILKRRASRTVMNIVLMKHCGSGVPVVHHYCLIALHAAHDAL